MKKAKVKWSIASGRMGSHRPRWVEVTLNDKGKLEKAVLLPYWHGPFSYGQQTITSRIRPERRPVIEKMAKETLAIQREAKQLGITERALRMRKKAATKVA